MDLHGFDPVTSKSVILRYEVKTNSGRKSDNERRADERLRKEGKAVHDVHVDLRKGTVHVDGKNARMHFEAVRQYLRRGRRNVHDQKSEVCLFRLAQGPTLPRPLALSKDHSRREWLDFPSRVVV